jgi:hypothetical protein
MPLQPVVFDCYVLAFEVAGFVEFSPLTLMQLAAPHQTPRDVGRLQPTRALVNLAEPAGSAPECTFREVLGASYISS